MNNCLVVTLKGVADNENLPLFNSLTLQCSSVSSYALNKAGLNITTSKEGTRVRIIGDGYFVDEDLVSNPVKIKYLNAGINKLYCSNGNYSIEIAAKNYITTLQGTGENASNVSRVWQLEDLSALRYCTNLTKVQLGSNPITGVIETDVPPSLTSFSFHSPKISGSINSLVEKRISEGQTSGTLINNSETSLRGTAVTVKDQEQNYVNINTLYDNFSVLINSSTSYSILNKGNTFGLDYNLVDGVWVASNHVF